MVEKKAELIKEKVGRMDGIRLANAQGALYLAIYLDFSKLSFQSSKELTLKFLEEENVFFLPGDAFKGGEMVRIVLMCSNEEIGEFVNRF